MDPTEDLTTCPCPRSSQRLCQRIEHYGGTARIKFQYQCTTCGRGHGLLARQPTKLDLPPWDYTLPFSEDFELEGEDGRAWWISYHEYLHSPEWENKRRRIYERECLVQGTDKPLCEACYRRPGSEVHHATYRHLRGEPLYELKWLCRVCHDYLHQRMGMRD